MCRPEGVTLAAATVQGLAAASITSLNALTAFTFAWPSYTVEMLSSNATVLSAPLTEAQAAMLGGLPNLGALLATPLCGFAMHRLGCRYAAMLFGLPFVACWALVACSRQVWAVLLGLAAGGAGAAGQAVGSVYIAELAQDAVRGALASTIVSGYFVGLLFSYLLGGYLSYFAVAWTHVALSLLYIASLTLIKESPVYLVRTSREKEAAVSIAFYRQIDVTSKVVQDEIIKIKAQLYTGDIVKTEPQSTSALLTPEGAHIANNATSISEWSFLRRSVSTQRALAAAVALTVASVFMGSAALQVYAEPLFAEAVPGVRPNTSAVLLAAVLLAGSVASGALVDRAGRRALMAGSALASGLAAAALAAQLHIHWAPPLLTALLIYVYSFSYNIGAAVVPFVLTAEIFLPEVRSLCNSIVLACLWVSYFVGLAAFRPLASLVGLPPLFYGFAAVALLTALACHRHLPETKGLSAYDIQPLFTPRAKHDTNTI